MRCSINANIMTPVELSVALAILIQRDVGYSHHISSAPLTVAFGSPQWNPTTSTNAEPILRVHDPGIRRSNSNPAHPLRYIHRNRHHNAHHPPPPEPQYPSSIEQVRSSRPVAIPFLFPLPMMSITVIQPSRFERTRKLQRRGTTLRQMVTQILARQHLLVRSRLDLHVDHPIPRDTIVTGCFVFRAEKIARGFVGHSRTIDELLGNVSREQMPIVVGGSGEVFAARNADSA